MSLLKKIVCAFLGFIGAFVIPLSLHAATLAEDATTFSRAQVLEVIEQRTETIIGTDTTHVVQRLRVRVLDGGEANQEVTFENDFVPLSVGQELYLRHTVNKLDSINMYSVADPYRVPTLAVLALLFVVLAVVFGGMQGVRGLVSLAGSVFLIFYVLLPGILHGWSALGVAVGVSSLIIILGSYVTHGFNRTTSAAVVGMIITVCVTGLMAYVSVHCAHLSGYNSEESAYLVLDTRGKVDLIGLLLGGIMIGLLGVLYDMAIGQAIAVEELKSVGAHLSRREIFLKGIRIGREHIGALINTLAIAYVGSSLTLLLLLQSATGGVLFVLNNEMFATEIIRIFVGSIGIILVMPITTLIAVYMVRYEKKPAGSHHHHTHV